MRIGILLRELRNEKGYSQEYVANQLDISQPSYCNLENDKTKLSISKANILAKLYNVPSSMFTEDSSTIVSYNTGSNSRTIINSKIKEDNLSLNERNLYEELLNEKNIQINDLKDEVKELRSHIRFLQDQLKVKEII